MIAEEDLEPQHIYWATLRDTPDGEPTVVQISTVFGASREYWSVAMLGTDQHFSLNNFRFLAKAEHPAQR